MLSEAIKKILAEESQVAKRKLELDPLSEYEYTTISMIQRLRMQMLILPVGIRFLMQSQYMVTR